MDTVEMLLLFDYYGDMLTDRQRMCLDLRYNQDLSLAEIAEESIAVLTWEEYLRVQSSLIVNFT